MAEATIERLEQDVQQLLSTLQQTREESVEQRTILTSVVSTLQETQKASNDMKILLAQQNIQLGGLEQALSDFKIMSEQNVALAKERNKEVDERITTIDRRHWMAMGGVTLVAFVAKIMPLFKFFQ
jgi:uncharacterized protein with gpF-like domain